MKRNAKSLATVTMAVVILAIAVLWWPRRERNRGPIEFVAIDTLRADRLPAYGYARGQYADAAAHLERAARHAAAQTTQLSDGTLRGSGAAFPPRN